jgi:hypothetical protein
VAETVHPQITMAMERFIPLKELRPKLDQLDAALNAHDAHAVRNVLNQILELDFPAASLETSEAPPVLYPLDVSTN